MGARRSRHFGVERSHANHPGQRARHAAHARRDHRTRDARRVPVSAARGTDRGSRRDRSARPLRHLRRDVGRGLFHRQPVTDGIGGQRRLRGRRRYRDDRERFPPPRKRRFAAARDAAGSEADRLHGGIDFGIADRSLHPAALHGWRRWPSVPRIFRDACVCDRDFYRGVAVGDADDLRLLRAAAAEPRRHLARSPRRGPAGAAGPVLRSHAHARARVTGRSC